MLLAFAIALFAGLANSAQPNDQGIANVDPKYCGCTEDKLPQCGCCVNIEEFNYTVCANLTYIEAELGIRFTLTVNGEVYINETLSGRNPPPLCRGVIGVADFCVKIYNISYEEDKFGGCLELYADFVERVFNLKLGCWYLDDEVGKPVAEDNVTKEPLDERAKLRSLFKISNNAKERIFDEMNKWSDKDGDLGVSNGIHIDRLPQEALVEEFEETNESL